MTDDRIAPSASVDTVSIGMRLADKVFAKRRCSVEAHLGKEELAALLTIAADTALASSSPAPTARERLGRWLAADPKRRWGWSFEDDGVYGVSVWRVGGDSARGEGATEDAAILDALGKVSR